MSRRAAGWFSALFLLTVLSPIRLNFVAEPPDSFPLSRYPMFSRPRPQWEARQWLVAVRADGSEAIIPYTYWSSSGHNQGHRALAAAAERGDEALLELCERVARKAGKRLQARWVSVRTGRFDLEVVFGEGDRKANRERELAGCPAGEGT
ncbi:hypothetical protein LBMAG42_09710 [Deltaproteobacteria bacterium]|nr:hypothetical protein LBMAG42_09710 [Deltaproteobacteria bacterium]